jgi:GNAT superfamily N-acetyltransferase
MTLSFSVDPASRWVFPDPNQYFIHFPTFVKHYGGGAFDTNSVHGVEGHEGFAMWLAPGQHPDDGALANFIRQSVAESRHAEIFDLVERMSASHPAEPHWFLPLIGVDPIWQGKGRGSELLKHMLAQCDREQQLAYLDSTNPKNIPLYERHGFKQLGVIEAGSCPPVYPMLRKPR